MLRIVVLDDSSEFIEILCKELQAILKEFCINYEIKVYEDYMSLLYDLKERSLYDIYFLDIEMPEINGIDLAKQIRQISKNSYIIFITSYVKYAIDGYEVNAFRYITKNNQLHNKLVNCIEAIVSREKYSNKEYFEIYTNSRKEKVYYEDIYYIYKNQKNSVFVVKNCREQEYPYIRDTLHNVYQKLDPDLFLFIEKGFIVNIYHVMRLDSSELLMRNGEKLVVSRGHLKEIKKRINEYWSERIV